MATRASPFFFRTPIRYLRWASHEKPAIFYSCVVGLMGPLSFLYAPPLRRFFGDTKPIPQIPLTYPIPKGPRKIPEGFDDPKE